jgi:hypothetical protein
MMDEVVAATYFRDHLVVITRRGRIYKVVYDEFTQYYTVVREIVEINLEH